MVDRSCPITGAPAPDYDWEADALGCWRVAIAEAKRRLALGEPQIPFFEKSRDNDDKRS